MSEEPQLDLSELISRPDPAFKEVTDKVARAVGLNLIGAELPQTLTADLVLEVPPGVKLDDTLFSFLAGYRYAVVDFKGQNDRLDMSKLLANVARTALFCIKNPKVEVRQVLNLLVCSRFPQEILRNVEGVAGFTRREAEGQPWLWVGKFNFQEIAIVVCRDLPLEPRFYDWLVFIPSDNKRWEIAVRAFMRARRPDLAVLAGKMHPKEFKDMQLDIDFEKIRREMSAKERARLDAEWAEVLEEEIPRLLREDPETLNRALRKVEPEILTRYLTIEQLETLLRKRKQKQAQPTEEPKPEPPAEEE